MPAVRFFAAKIFSSSMRRRTFDALVTQRDAEHAVTGEEGRLGVAGGDPRRGRIVEVVGHAAHKMLLP